MSNTQKSIVSGMTVLSLVGIICKIVGALYRIPLAWLIGDEGMGTYQLHPDEKNWELEEIVRQLNVVRSHPTGGAAQFRSKFVTDNTKGVYDYLRLFYPTPALVPAMTWLSDTLPSAPQALRVTIDKHTTTLTWEETDDDVLYNVYSSNTFPVDTDNAANLQCTYLSEPCHTEATQSIVHPRHYALTATAMRAPPCSGKTTEFASSHPNSRNFTCPIKRPDCSKETHVELK